MQELLYHSGSFFSVRLVFVCFGKNKKCSKVWKQVENNKGGEDRDVSGEKKSVIFHAPRERKVRSVSGSEKKFFFPVAQSDRAWFSLIRIWATFVTGISRSFFLRSPSHYMYFSSSSSSYSGASLTVRRWELASVLPLFFALGTLPLFFTLNPLSYIYFSLYLRITATSMSSFHLLGPTFFLIFFPVLLIRASTARW